MRRTDLVGIKHNHFTLAVATKQTLDTHEPFSAARRYLAHFNVTSWLCVVVRRPGASW